MINEPDEDSDNRPRSETALSGLSCFGLLRDSELEDLRPLLRLIVDRLDEVLDGWYSAYSAYFGNARSLSRPEFFEAFKPCLRDSLGAMLEGRVIEYSARISRLAEMLAERRVPFTEVALSLHMYEDSAFAIFPECLRTLQMFRVFDKLSHARLAILAESYFRVWSATAGTRIEELESDAGLLPSDERSVFHAIVGSSPAMRRLYDHIEAAAQVRGTVLLVGESGTGKELVARAIHESALAPGDPFIAVNCAAIPRDLIESELFGYQRGAFSGANSHFLGLFRSAEKGTLFLDEVTEMSPETQSKILRAIQERTVRPLGSTRELPIDVRLIATTNRDPEEAVKSGQLRQDLYYRLQANVLYMPPLRARVEDIPLLVEHFIKLFNSRMRRLSPVTGIEDNALQAMLNYPWPGNVRELSNAIETAMTFGRRTVIDLEDLPHTVVRNNQQAAWNEAPVQPPSAAGPDLNVAPFLTTFEASERELVTRALIISGGNKTRAAKLLQISRKKLYSLTNKYLPAVPPESKP